MPKHQFHKSWYTPAAHEHKHRSHNNGVHRSKLREVRPNEAEIVAIAIPEEDIRTIEGSQLNVNTGPEVPQPGASTERHS